MDDDPGGGARSTVLRFPDTRWSLVLRAGSTDDGARTRALAELCEAYWPPLYAFARLHGADRPTAEEQVQGFFADFLERGGFDRADEARGRLRTYLLASLKHFLSHERERTAALKRGQLVTSPATMDEIDTIVSRDASLDPEEGFMRVWATQVLQHTLAELRTDYARRGKADVFDALAPYLVDGAGADTTASAAEKLGMNPGAAKVALHRIRRRFGERLRAEVAHTVSEPSDVDAEIQALLSVMTSL